MLFKLRLNYACMHWIASFLLTRLTTARKLLKSLSKLTVKTVCVNLLFETRTDTELNFRVNIKKIGFGKFYFRKKECIGHVLIGTHFEGRTRGGARSILVSNGERSVLVDDVCCSLCLFSRRYFYAYSLASFPRLFGFGE